MNYAFEIGSIRIEVEYRTAKTLRITVYPPDGRVKIAAPKGTAPEIIKKFALSKIEWVQKHRQKFLDSAGTKAKPSGALKNHSTMYVWGAPYELEIIERSGNPKIVLADEQMKFYVRPGSSKAKRQEYLDKWYSKLLKEAAPPVIEKWEAQIGVEVKKLYVQKMKTHWGSCNYARQTMRLNSELAKRNPDYLEYVVVHEMLHIIEKGHNKKFYRLLSKYIPGWKVIRKKMNSGDF